MFKIIDNPTFTHDVTVMVPVDGGHEEQSLGVTFRDLPLERLQALEPGFDIAKQRTYCEEVVAGFSKLVDEKGKHVECTDALRAALLDKPYVQLAIITAYNGAMAQAKAKN